MNRKQEGNIFVTAVKGLFSGGYLLNKCMTRPQLAKGLGFGLHVSGDLTVLYPVGTAYRKCAVAVVAKRGTDHPFECGARNMICTAGYQVHIHKDGSNVMERTGANAALRREAEDTVLCE